MYTMLCSSIYFPVDTWVISALLYVGDDAAVNDDHIISVITTHSIILVICIELYIFIFIKPPYYFL